jgi:hypothetical protein
MKLHEIKRSIFPIADSMEDRWQFDLPREGKTIVARARQQEHKGPAQVHLHGRKVSGRKMMVAFRSTKPPDCCPMLMNSTDKLEVERIRKDTYETSPDIGCDPRRQSERPSFRAPWQ